MWRCRLEQCISIKSFLNMKPEKIKLTDWARIFAGEVPAEFYIELILRAALIYLLLMVSMRMMGKRMSTQMSRLEMAAMVSLAAAIGVPLMSPDRGILPAVIIAAVVVMVTRALSAWSARNEKVESMTQDHLDTLIVDGVLQNNTMKKVRISREQILAHLRNESLLHTGQVQRLYMEANGAFSMVRSQTGKAGLLVLPEWDGAFVQKKVESAGIRICKQCALPKAAGEQESDCPNCGCREWAMAVQEK